MRKQKKQFIIIICILILGVVGYIVAKNIPKEDETVVGTESHTVTSIVQENVTEISYLYEGDIVELIKVDDVWKSKNDESLTIDQTSITNMLSYVCNITTETVIENPESLAEYGLTSPENTISLMLTDGSVVQLLIGNYLDITGEYYILLVGDTNVYTVPSYIAAAYNKSIDLLIETEGNTE